MSRLLAPLHLSFQLRCLSEYEGKQKIHIFIRNVTRLSNTKMQIFKIKTFSMCHKFCKISWIKSIKTLKTWSIKKVWNKFQEETSKIMKLSFLFMSLKTISDWMLFKRFHQERKKNKENDEHKKLHNLFFWSIMFISIDSLHLIKVETERKHVTIKERTRSFSYNFAKKLGQEA